MLKILIVDDEAPNREAIQEMLVRMGHEVDTACDGHEALGKATVLHFDLILSDLRMPRMDGLQFFESMRNGNYLQDKRTSFAFMTAYGQTEEAVRLMKHGAINFLCKPLRKKDLLTLTAEVISLKAAWRSHEGAPLTRTQSTASTQSVIYKSRSFAAVVDLVDRIAATSASVLILGESGTGKEVLARRLHEQSPRAQQPFIAVNAAAIPENLLESELFGYERGAFTGADHTRVGQIRSAHGGTFFIDEIASMSLSVQAKLLRVVQEKKVQPLGATAPFDVDVRWLSAANVNLDEMVARGQFREDLLYRLKVVVIEVPPLRARLEDIDCLLDYFANEFSQAMDRNIIVPESSRQMLRSYQWPGNVRELRNVVERASALSRDGVCTSDLLPPHISGQVNRPQEVRITLGSSLQSAEDRIIEETLRFCKGDKMDAANILGINPRTIYRWLERQQPLSELSEQGLGEQQNQIEA